MLKKMMFPDIRLRFRRCFGRVLIALTGIIPVLVLVACGSGAASGPIVATYPKPTPEGERVNLDMYLVGRYDTRVSAGENATFFLEVRNTGNKTITNIRLSAIAPDRWTVNFRPMTIDSLTPENFQTIDLTVMPDANTAEGSHNITVIADATEVRKVMDIYLTVQAREGFWLWVGIIILLVVVAGFIVVYLRFGRK